MNLREYQLRAVESWVASGYKSIFAMATGTGKTATAMECMRLLHQKLRSEYKSLTVVVVCPLIHLIDQWAVYFEEAGWRVTKAYQSKAAWASEIIEQSKQSATTPGLKQAVIVTQATFTGGNFQQALNEIPGEILLVGDEVHNLGAKSVIGKLPLRAGYRLGLSATPSRWGDSTGTELLVQYFGEISYTLTISDAIALGALCEYKYFPRVTYLTFEETLEYVELTKALGQILKGRNFEELSDVEQEKAGKILRFRAAVIGMAREKMPQLLNDLKLNKNKPGQLIYCPEGSSAGVRFIDEFRNQLTSRGFFPAEIYDANTKKDHRRGILESFTRGELPYILSMRCLDEGVDIPSAEYAYFVSSSSNPRQFVQRRGRVLRQNGGKEMALIYDYFVVPNLLAVQEALDVEISIGKRELFRVLDFIDACSNKAEALLLIEPLRKFYE